MAITTILGFMTVALALMFLSFWLLANHAIERLQTLGSKPNQIILQRSPTRLSRFELASITFAILKKHSRVFTGQAAKLKADPTQDQSIILPELTVRGLLEVDASDLKKFHKAVSLCAPAHGSDESTVSPFLLITTTGPVIPFILAHDACPINPLGSVNTRNTFRIFDPVFCRDAQAIRESAQAEELSFIAFIGGSDYPAQRRKRGVEFRITVYIERRGIVVLSQELHFLQFLAPSQPPLFKPSSDSAGAETSIKDRVITSESPRTVSEIKLTAQDPREWAACCRDYNPIHVSAVMAKLFGFPSVIAHGNHAVALILQQLYNQPPFPPEGSRATARQIIWNSKRSVTIDMKFVKPMILPVRAQVQWQASTETNTERGVCVDFSISKGQTPYTVGSCSTTLRP